MLDKFFTQLADEVSGTMHQSGSLEKLKTNVLHIFFEAQFLTLKNEKSFCCQRSQDPRSTTSSKESSLVDAMSCWSFGYAVIRDEANRYEAEQKDQDNMFGVICLDAELHQDLNLSDIKWAYVATGYSSINRTVRSPM